MYFIRKIRLIIDNQRGFSLLEMGIVILIMGIIISGILPTIKRYQVIQQKQIMSQRIELIMNAIAAYVIEEKHFPKSKITSATPTLDYEALGLQEKDIKDTFGNYIIYVVDGNINQPLNNHICLFDLNHLKKIKINGCDKLFPFLLIIPNMPKYEINKAQGIEKQILNYRGTSNLPLPKSPVRPILVYRKFMLFMKYYANSCGILPSQLGSRSGNTDTAQQYGRRPVRGSEAGSYVRSSHRFGSSPFTHTTPFE